jgi:hypothetical protein
MVVFLVLLVPRMTMVAPDAEAAEFTSAIGGTAEIDRAPVLVASTGFDPNLSYAGQKSRRAALSLGVLFFG